MSSSHNDLTESLFAACRRKDEMIEAYREKIKILEQLIEVKNQRLKLHEDFTQELLAFVDKSYDKFADITKITNKFLGIKEK